MSFNNSGTEWRHRHKLTLAILIAAFMLAVTMLIARAWTNGFGLPTLAGLALLVRWDPTGAFRMMLPRHLRRSAFKRAGKFCLLGFVLAAVLAVAFPR